MKQLQLTFLLTLLMSMVGTQASAYDIVVSNADGKTIYYEWANNKTELSVCTKSTTLFNIPSYVYSGRIVIPETVTYNGKSYSVTSIESYAFMYCADLTSVEIPNSVTSIGSHVFIGCSSLNSINVDVGNTRYDSRENCNAIIETYTNTLIVGCFQTIIPNSVTSIGAYAFEDCTGLTSIEIPNSVTSIGSDAFYNCKGLTSVTIPNSVTSIGSEAFRGCTGLTSIEIPNSVTSIGQRAFSSSLNSINVDVKNTKYDSRDNCNAIIETATNTLIIGCSQTIIPNSVTSIGAWAFYGCNGLASIEIPNSVTSIGDRAFSMCYSVTSIEIPNSVTSIGEYAFWGCRGLTSIEIPNNVTSIGEGSFGNCTGLASVTIPNSVTSIGSSAFEGCRGLTSLEIPNSVTSIGGYAFYGTAWYNNQPDGVIYAGRVAYKYKGTMPKETTISLKEGTAQITTYAFSGCVGLTSIEIPNSVTLIGEEAFSDCKGLTNITIPGSVTSIGNNAFRNCSSLTSVTIGNGVTSIGNDAFYGCSSLKVLSLPDNLTSIENIGYESGTVVVNKGTRTLLLLWLYNKSHYQNYTIINKTDGLKIVLPAFTIDNITQTTAMIYVDNVDMGDGFTYTLNGEQINQTEIKLTGLKPESNQNLSLVISKDELSYTVTGNSFTTKGLDPRVEDQYEVTASSIRAKGTYTAGDAKVVAQRMLCNGNLVEGNEGFASGLNPGRSYTVVCEIDVDYGGETPATYRATKDIYTEKLKFSVAQPKVVSKGNAIVSASVNLDPEEENVGFEWRRTDWTNEFPSNTGKAYLYDGVIEGYIKNLNTDKLFKFRPYYLSDDGTYHYGDWMGLDPTNTSYFEPTVHTYAKINIEGNTALVRGYALAGTENIKVQGFKYWKTSYNNITPRKAPTIPSNAKTIEAVGQQIITATLAALEYSTTYHYVAFVTTEDGTTYYGEEQVFTTPMAPAGIDDVIADEPSSTSKKGVYTLTGVKLADELSELQGLPQGVYIVDGKKVMVK